MACCNKLRCAYFGAVSGLFLIAAALITTHFLFAVIRSKIVDGLALRPASHDADAYHHWYTNNNTDSPQKFWRIHFFNITNPDEVAKNMKPRVEEVGPYVFREWRSHPQAQFSGDETSVRFYELTSYTFVPEQSKGSLDDTITSVWTAFATGAASAKGVFPLAVGLSSAFLQQSLGAFSGYVALSEKNQTKANQIVAAQWGSLAGFGTVTANQSFAYNDGLIHILSLFGFPFQAGLLQALQDSKNAFPEFAAFTRNQGKPMTFDMDTAYDLLYGGATSRCPLMTIDIDGIPCTAKLVKDQAHAGTSIFPSLTPQQYGSLVGYLLAGASTTLKYTAGKANALPSDSNSFFFATRKPLEWIFNYEDPLQILLGNSGHDANTAYFPQNFTSAEDWINTNPEYIWELKTGTDNVDNTYTYLNWKNRSTLLSRKSDPDNGFWCNDDIPVTGHSNNQFAPGKNGVFSWDNTVTKDSKFPVFVAELLRAGLFSYSKDAQVKGVDTLAFTIDDDAFAPDVKFSQYYWGLVNLTCPQEAPVFLSEPHFHRARNFSGGKEPTFPAAWEVDGEGIYDSNPDIHETYLFIQPQLGTVIRGCERLQINVKLDYYGSNPYLVPVMWVEQEEMLTDKQASDINDQVVFAFAVQKGVFFGGIIGGCVIAAFSIGAVIYLKRQRSTRSLQYPEAEALLEDN